MPLYEDLKVGQVDYYIRIQRLERITGSPMPILYLDCFQSHVMFAIYCLQISWQVCGTEEGDPFRVPCQSSVIDVDLASGRMMG